MVMQPKKPISAMLENVVFYLSLLLLAASIGAFFYLQNSFNTNNAKLADLAVEMAKQKTVEQKEIEDYILITRQKLDDASSLLNNHKIITNFFKDFEVVVHPEVYFTQFDMDSSGLGATLSGHAKTFEALGQQIMLLKSATNTFGEVKLEKVTANDKGGVDFSLAASINSQTVGFNKEQN